MQISEHGFTEAQCMATQMNYPYIKSPHVILTATPSSWVPPPLISLFLLPPSPFALMTLTAKFLESYSRLQRVTFNGIQSFNSEKWPLLTSGPTATHSAAPLLSPSPWKWIAQRKNGSRQSLKLFTEPPKERWMKLIHHWARDSESNADWKASQRESKQGRETDRDRKGYLMQEVMWFEKEKHRRCEGT